MIQIDNRLILKRLIISFRIINLSKFSLLLAFEKQTSFIEEQVGFPS